MKSFRHFLWNCLYRRNVNLQTSCGRSCMTWHLWIKCAYVRHYFYCCELTFVIVTVCQFMAQDWAKGCIIHNPGRKFPKPIWHLSTRNIVQRLEIEFLYINVDFKLIFSGVSSLLLDLTGLTNLQTDDQKHFAIH